MNKYQVILILISILNLIRCKNEPQVKFDIPSGIWIAEDYYNSFEKTNSVIKSKKAFDSNNPVGLRINYEEIKGSNMNIGYSVLHSHLISPEVSGFTLSQANDTIHEQGYFKIDINKGGTTGHFETTEIYPFCYEWKSFITYDTINQKVIISRPPNERYDSTSITYIRIDTSFDKSYPFPNPIYSYLRNKVLTGEYTVRDSMNNVLTEKLTISQNGTMEGFEKFDNMIINLSTDIYCGPPVYLDLVLIFENIPDYDKKSYAYSLNQSKDGILQLGNNNIVEKEFGKVIYTLERH